MDNTVEITMTWDDHKNLRDGKRRYSDSDGHNLYLMGPEVEKLGEPDAIVVTVKGK